jgi:hypothetical protein
MLLLLASGTMAGCNLSLSEKWSSGGETLHETYLFTTLARNDKPYFLFVFDEQYGPWHTSAEGRWSGSGAFTNAQGKAVKWICETKDGLTGTVTIGEEVFDLANGLVFLVKFQNDTMVVKQMMLDQPKFSEGTTSAIIKQALSLDPQVKTFFDLP